MRCRCASVRVTLVAAADGGGCGWPAASGEQPVNAIATIAATRAANARGPLALRDLPQEELFPMIVLGEFRAMPPATAKRLKQRRCIGITAGLGLHETDPGLLVGLLRSQQSEVAGVTVLHLPLCQVECHLGSSFRRGARLQAL